MSPRSRQHFFRPGVCVNGKPPAAKQARKRRRRFAHALARSEFGQRHGQRSGNALSLSVLRWSK
jgi:hypothetical protein